MNLYLNLYQFFAHSRANSIKLIVCSTLFLGVHTHGFAQAPSPESKTKAQPISENEANTTSSSSAASTSNQSDKTSPLKSTSTPKLKKRSKKRSKKKKRKKKVWPTKRPKRALKSPPTLGKIPFSLGEHLIYKVNVRNTHAGTVTTKVSRLGDYQGQRVVEVGGFIQSSPFFDNFYPIQDSLIVLMEERTFRPLKSIFHLKEKGREVKYTSLYDLKTGIIDWTKLKKKERKRKHKSPGIIYESLSSLYAIRRLDLKVGLEFEHYVWDGQRERLASFHAVSEERVLTELGWIDTVRVEINSVITGGFISRKMLRRPPVKGVGWFAKDPYRTPVKLITPTRLGQAEAILIKSYIETE